MALFVFFMIKIWSGWAKNIEFMSFLCHLFLHVISLSLRRPDRVKVELAKPHETKENDLGIKRSSSRRGFRWRIRLNGIAHWIFSVLILNNEHFFFYFTVLWFIYKLQARKHVLFLFLQNKITHSCFMHG